MQFVGKILVVLQLVLSVFFMAFAGVVFNTQMKWRDYAKMQGDKLAAEQGKLRDKESELALYKTEMTGKVNEANKELAVAQAQITNLDNATKRLQKEVNEVNVAQKISAEQAQIAGDEAQARNEEALNQRKLNVELQKARDVDLRGSMAWMTRSALCSSISTRPKPRIAICSPRIRCFSRLWRRRGSRPIRRSWPPATARRRASRELSWT